MPGDLTTTSTSAASRRDTADTPRGWAVTLAGVAVVWVALLGAMTGIGLLITGPLSGWLTPGEPDFSRSLEDARTSALTQAAEVGGTGGDTITIVALAVAVAGLAWFWTRSARPAVFLLVGMVGQAGLYLLAGMAVTRRRPPVKLLDHGLDPTHSFPSGHVCTAVMFWGGCAVLLWLYADKRWRPLAVVLALVPPVVALSRLYQGAHYLTDVGTSLVIVPVWVGALAYLLLRPGVSDLRGSGRPRPVQGAAPG